MKTRKVCGCRVTKTRRGTPALKCSEPAKSGHWCPPLWRFLSKKQAASLRKNKAPFCTTLKSKKRGRRK